ELAGPGATHLRGLQVAAVDDPERLEQFVAEFVGAPAVIGQRCKRAYRLEFAVVDAEIGLQSPDRNDDFAGHAISRFDAPQHRATLLQRSGHARHTRWEPPARPRL